MRRASAAFSFRGWRWVEMVGVAGFEPATPCSRSRCATGLRYTPAAVALAGGHKQVQALRIPNRKANACALPGFGA